MSAPNPNGAKEKTENKDEEGMKKRQRVHCLSCVSFLAPGPRSSARSSTAGSAGSKAVTGKTQHLQLQVEGAFAYHIQSFSARRLNTHVCYRSAHAMQPVQSLSDIIGRRLSSFLWPPPDTCCRVSACASPVSAKLGVCDASASRASR
jgi:hypothetical protein